MREILFRAWDKVSKKYREFDGMHDTMTINEDGKVEYYNLQNGSGGNEYILEQFTGLTDKNGKKIFEDDIVLAVYGRWHEEPKGLRRICKIVYDKKTCSFRMAVTNSKVLVSFGDSRSKDIEVIGNVHDNPELLEAKS